MKPYNILLMHGPVQNAEYIGNDSVIYTLKDGRKFIIKFSFSYSKGKKMYRRDITDENGSVFFDFSEFDLFDDGLSLEDYAQWTADNISEIEELTK